MRGFIIGTIATAITFAIVAYLLPQIDYGGNVAGLIVVSVIAGVVNGVIKPIIKSRNSVHALSPEEFSLLHGADFRHRVEQVILPALWAGKLVIADLAQKHWNLLVNNIAKGDTAIFNEPVFPKGEQRGFGFHEAPSGTLSHWVVIRDGTIATSSNP